MKKFSVIILCVAMAWVFWGLVILAASMGVKWAMEVICG